MGKNVGESKSEFIMSPNETPEDRKSRSHSKTRGHSQSMQINLDDDDEKKLETLTEKQSQSLNVVSDKQAVIANDSEFELKLDNYSSINCISELPSKAGISIIDQTKTKTSYYVRDDFKPLQSHQTNIEKLLE